MPWPLSQQEKFDFIQFLEPNPPTNNHGKISIRHFSFYSSELKSLGQVIRTLDVIRNGGNQGDTIAEVRYRNTLTNLGLIVDNNGTYILSPLGIQVLQYCAHNNLNIEKFADSDPNNRRHAIAIETLILSYLVNELIDGNVNGLCTDTFKRILFNAQEVIKSIPQQEVVNVVSNEFRCYFFQLINSTGYEIKRFYRLSSANQTAFETLWKNTSDDPSFPGTPPTDLIELMVYRYCLTRAKAVLQYDIRFRVQSFLQAYLHCLQQFGDNMPILDQNLQNLNQRKNINIMRVDIRDFDLGTTSTPSPTDIPRHRIISGCPGSGKSMFLDGEILKLQNAKKIKTSFHQESTYFDFVGTYKPTPLYEKNSDIVNAIGAPFPLGKPVINYTYVIGPLIEAYLYAIKNPNWNIVLVIDEINRGNVGVIFGDFFQLLDRDPANNFESKYSIQPNADLLEFLHSLNFLQPILDTTENHIKLPGNLFIWGTMNSADQGVFPLDSAFRRRWEFEYKGYNESCVYGTTNIKYNNTDISWDSFRKAINEKLLKDLNVPEDKLIGPYFLTQNEISNPEKVMHKLFLYLWDDVVRFQQKQIMEYDSFADLKADWKNGAGKIFNFI